MTEIARSVGAVGVLAPRPVLPRADSVARPALRRRARAEASPPLPVTVALLACIAVLGRGDIRALALAGAGALLALAFPAVARWPAALLVGWGAMRTGWAAGAAALAVLASLLVWPRPATLLRRLGVVLAVSAAAFAASHQPAVALSAAASVVVLLAPLEDVAPRWALALALLAAAVPGGVGGWKAWSAHSEARRSGDEAAWARADEACSAIGWAGCTEDALVARAHLARKRGDDAAALALLARVAEPARPETELLRAEVELALGQSGPAQARLWRLAKARPSARGALSPEAALAWARALDRADRKADARAVLEGVPGPDAEQLRLLLGAPGQPADPCLRAQLAKDLVAAHLCLDRVPDHAPSLALLGKPLPGAPPTPEDESFGGAIALTRPEPPSRCVKRGEVPPISFTWQVQDGFGRDEGFVVFVHAVGPRVLGFDHLPGGRQTSTLVPGERFADPLTSPVPNDAPPGHYDLMVGLYSPASSVRLQPRSLPTHITFFHAGSFEVCP